MAARDTSRGASILVGGLSAVKSTDLQQWLRRMQLRHHLETNRIDCNYNNNTINNININTR